MRKNKKYFVAIKGHTKGDSMVFAIKALRNYGYPLIEASNIIKQKEIKVLEGPMTEKRARAMSKELKRYSLNVIIFKEI